MKNWKAVVLVGRPGGKPSQLGLRITGEDYSEATRNAIDKAKRYSGSRAGKLQFEVRDLVLLDGARKSNPAAPAPLKLKIGDYVFDTADPMGRFGRVSLVGDFDSYVGAWRIKVEEMMERSNGARIWWNAGKNIVKVGKQKGAAMHAAKISEWRKEYGLMRGHYRDGDIKKGMNSRPKEGERRSNPKRKKVFWADRVELPAKSEIKMSNGEKIVVNVSADYVRRIVAGLNWDDTAYAPANGHVYAGRRRPEGGTPIAYRDTSRIHRYFDNVTDITPERKSNPEGGPLLTPDNIQEATATMYAGLKAAFVQTKYSTLGGADRGSILILVSTEPRDRWPNGYVENSNYGRWHLHHDGNLDQFTNGFRGAKKFRKVKVKSVEDAIAKINAYVKGLATA